LGLTLAGAIIDPKKSQLILNKLFKVFFLKASERARVFGNQRGKLEKNQGEEIFIL
jgi:hypothetical protein